MEINELKYPNKSHTRDILSGKRFGKVLVIKRDHRGNDRRWFYLCRCDCGKEFIIGGRSLLKGSITSCGCDKKKENKIKKHLYRTWCGMKSRCYNKNNLAYKNYGGRGIKICKEWLNNFDSFMNWAINNGFEETLSIDRINVNGDYEPSNCRWATAKQQADNKTCNILITINGRAQNLQQWCDEYKIKRSTVMTRVLQCGWDYIRAITTPKREKRKTQWVPCACGCGTMIETPDSKGRERKFVSGHNNRIKNNYNK